MTPSSRFSTPPQCFLQCPWEGFQRCLQIEGMISPSHGATTTLLPTGKGSGSFLWYRNHLTVIF